MIQDNFDLSTVNWLGVGGRAKHFCLVESADEIVFVLKKYSTERKFILGNGSNVLFSDDNFDGLVIKLSDKFDILDKQSNYIQVGGSVLTKRLAKFCIENEIGGLEFLNTIPATIGGCVVMNAGCFGKEIKDVLHSIEYIDFLGNCKIKSAQEIIFKYRHTNLTNIIITKVFLNYYSDRKENIQNNINEFLERRRTTQPIGKTCGSTFKNPPNDFAGRLIEQAGLKGYRIGGVKVSEKHANFLINDKNGTATDIINLISYIRQEVLKNSGILLEEEVRVVG